MLQGIGRTGNLLLSFVFFAVGLFGLALAWAAFSATAEAFFLMGLGVTALAMLGLWTFASFVPREALRQRPARTQPRRETNNAVPVAPTRAPTEAPVENFEFEDYQPAAQAAPEQVVLPPAFTAQAPAPTPHAAPAQSVQFQSRDPAAWPGKRDKSTWTRQMEHKQQVDAQVETASRRHELTDRYTQTTPTVRAIMDDKASQVPERLANRAPNDMNTDFVAPGMSIGRCGQCKTTLLAPEERPIRLKCPECAKVTRLD